MYQIENWRQALVGSRASPRGVPRVSRTTVLLGFNSLLTDVSSEMVSTILPIYLIFGLHLAPVQFGVVDGLYQGGSVLVRAVAGVIADRRENHKLIAAIGYGLSAITRVGFVLVRGPFAALTGLVMLDRIGKGIRTAPRDAMISLSNEPKDLGFAFGVHRALDTAGAMIGPLLAFLILTVAPDAFDAVFVVSLSFAVAGLSLLVLLVRNPERRAAAAERRTVTVRRAGALLAQRPFRLLAIAGAALSLATISDSFVYLAIQDDIQFQMGFFPLLYVATALVFMLLAAPIGRLADRFGRKRTFLMGYATLALTYVSLLVPGLGFARVLIAVTLLGTYYAMTDGVLPALASALVPEELRASGLGILATATGATRLIGSLLFGLAWTGWGLPVAIGVFLLTLVICGLFVALLLRRGTEPPALTTAGA